MVAIAGTLKSLYEVRIRQARGRGKIWTVLFSPMLSCLPYKCFFESNIVHPRRVDIMAIDMFLKVEGVTGESKDSNHTGWTDITSFSWGASQPGNMSVGGGGGAGKVNFNDLHVNALIDKSTTAILKHCASGKHLTKVELSVCKAGGQQVEYSRITLEDVLVTSVQYTGADNGDTVGVTYAFQAAKVKQQYWEQTTSGGKGAESSAGWNIKENKEA